MTKKEKAKVPKFEKRHFEWLAEVISQLSLPDDDLDRHRSVATQFAEYLMTTNPQFDAQRFIEKATTWKLP